MSNRRHQPISFYEPNPKKQTQAQKDAEFEEVFKRMQQRGMVVTPTKARVSVVNEPEVDKRILRGR